MTREQQIEGVLFYMAEPMKIAALARLFDLPESDIHAALTELQERLADGAIQLLTTDTEVQLVTSPELADILEQLRKDTQRKDIGKAGAETLAIVLYRGPLTRSEIDRIRGVNSTFILRNLLVRGLIERREHSDKRSYIYATTPDLLAHLGITKREALPQYAEIMDQLDAFTESEAASS